MYFLKELGKLGGLFFLKCNYDLGKSKIKLNTFYIELLQFWSDFRNLTCKNQQSKEIIWNNKNICIGGEPVFYEKLFRCGIVTFKDFMLDKRFKSQKQNQQKSEKKVVRRRRPLSLPTRGLEYVQEVRETVSVATQTEKDWWKVKQGFEDSVINKKEVKDLRNNDEDSDGECNLEVFKVFHHKTDPFPHCAMLDQRMGVNSITVR